MPFSRSRRVFTRVALGRSKGGCALAVPARGILRLAGIFSGIRRERTCGQALSRAAPLFETAFPLRRQRGNLSCDLQPHGKSFGTARSAHAARDQSGGKILRRRQPLCGGYAVRAQRHKFATAPDDGDRPARCGGFGIRIRYFAADPDRNPSFNADRRSARKTHGETEKKMKYLALIVPVLFAAVFLYAAVKKVKLYDAFTTGIKGAIPLIVSVFPYVAAILMLSELFEASGFSATLTRALAPVFRVLGIPEELSKLVLVKPFSGSGATALLSEILNAYGADSYIGRCACVCYGSSETVFYISAVYFANVKQKKLFKPVCIALFANFATIIVGCQLCKLF